MSRAVDDLALLVDALDIGVVRPVLRSEVEDPGLLEDGGDESAAVESRISIEVFPAEDIGDAIERLSLTLQAVGQ